MRANGPTEVTTTRVVYTIDGPHVNWRDVSDVFAVIQQAIPKANQYDDVVIVEPWDDDGIKISYDKKHEKGDER